MSRTKNTRTKQVAFNQGKFDGSIFRGNELRAPEGIRLALAGKHFDKDYQAGVQAAFCNYAE